MNKKTTINTQPQPTAEPQLLDKSTVAQRLGVTTRTLEHYVKSGRIPAVRLSSRNVKFFWSDIVAALR